MDCGVDDEEAAVGEEKGDINNVLDDEGDDDHDHDDDHDDNNNDSNKNSAVVNQGLYLCCNH